MALLAVFSLSNPSESRFDKISSQYSSNACIIWASAGMKGQYDHDGQLLHLAHNSARQRREGTMFPV